MPRQISRLVRLLKQQQGFTIVEVLVSFLVLVMVIGGLTTAMTASMRLNGVQKQRAQAQDIARDVISRYLKNEDYDAVNPFDDTAHPPANHYPPEQPVTRLLYQIYGNVEENNLDEYGLELLKPELARLNQPTLQILMRPVKKDDGSYYDTKLNAIVRITWDGHRMVELPAVIGQGDVTRTQQGLLAQPTTLPSSAPTTPTPTPTSSTVSSATPTPSESVTPTPTPSESTCLAAGTVCGTNSTCSNDCCSGASTNDMGTRTCD